MFKLNLSLLSRPLFQRPVYDKLKLFAGSTPSGLDGHTLENRVEVARKLISVDVFRQVSFSFARSNRSRYAWCTPWQIAKIFRPMSVLGSANYGRLDILVNNSGVYEFAPLEAITEESFHRLFNLNVLGLLLVTQAAAKYLGEGGSIINVGSSITRLKPASTAVYTATKGAVDMITSVLAKALAPRKIRVNSLNPGIVETEGTHTAGVMGTDMEKGFVSQTPLGRVGHRVTFLPLPSSWLPKIPVG
jgi:NAD(P)-dependent dehydrogenase (short-subunit alcohol dehydrogenase family)